MSWFGVRSGRVSCKRAFKQGRSLTLEANSSPQSFAKCRNSVRFMPPKATTGGDAPHTLLLTRGTGDDTLEHRGIGTRGGGTSGGCRGNSISCTRHRGRACPCDGSTSNRVDVIHGVEQEVVERSVGFQRVESATAGVVLDDGPSENKVAEVLCDAQMERGTRADSENNGIHLEQTPLPNLLSPFRTAGRTVMQGSLQVQCLLQHVERSGRVPRCSCRVAGYVVKPLRNARNLRCEDGLRQLLDRASRHNFRLPIDLPVIMDTAQDL